MEKIKSDARTVRGSHMVVPNNNPKHWRLGIFYFNHFTLQCSFERTKEGTAERLDFASQMYVPLYRIKQIGKFMRLTFAFFISIVLSVPAMAQDIVLKTKLALDGQGNAIREAVIV